MAFYLLPGVMYKRVVKTTRNIKFLTENDENHFTFIPSLTKAYKVYTHATRQYLGLGFLLQFVPFFDTNAKKASKQLSNQLKSAINKLIPEYKQIPNFTYYQDGSLITINFFHKFANIYSLYSYLNFGLIFSTLGYVTDGFFIQNIQSNFKKSINKLFLKLPVIRDFYNEKLSFKDKILNALWNFKNPAAILDSILNFIHLSANRIIETGSKKSSLSNWWRFLAKGFVAIILGIIKIPVRIVKLAINLVLHALKTLIFNPIAHIGISIAKRCKKKVLILTKAEKKELKALKKAAKQQHKNCYDIQILNDDLSAISKVEIPSETNEIVAIKGEPQIIAKKEALLSIVSIFAKKNEATPPSLNPEAVIKAVEILYPPK